jgi:acetylornithine aminotransferase
VQGEGGVRLLPAGYLHDVAGLCKDRGILFMIDEVQTGMCRTGRFWAHQHCGLDPDVFTTAKALANGLPMGAMLAREEVAAGFCPGSHASTFGGGALVSAVAAKVVAMMTEGDIAGRAADTGAYALGLFEGVRAKHPSKVAEVRGLGLIIGIELTFPGSAVWKSLLAKGFILNLTQDKVLRLLPPLTIAREDLAAFAQALDETLASS